MPANGDLWVLVFIVWGVENLVGSMLNEAFKRCWLCFDVSWYWNYSNIESSRQLCKLPLCLWSGNLCNVPLQANSLRVMIFHFRSFCSLIIVNKRGDSKICVLNRHDMTCRSACTERRSAYPLENLLSAKNLHKFALQLTEMRRSVFITT